MTAKADWCVSLSESIDFFMGKLYNNGSGNVTETGENPVQVRYCKARYVHFR